MEFIVNLGFCNDKLACGLKFGQGILTTVEEQNAYFSHPPISMARLQRLWQIVANPQFGLSIHLFSIIIWNNFQRIYQNLVNNGLNV